MTLATADGSTGDGADDGLGLDAGVVDAAPIVDGCARLGVALAVDGAVAHAEPTTTMATNHRYMTASIAISCVTFACAAAENAYSRAKSYGPASR